MNQLSNGTRVRYGRDRNKGSWADLATIRGFTLLDTGIHYVLENGRDGNLFVRHHDMVVKEPIGLAEHIAEHCQVRVLVNRECGKTDLQGWIQEALDTYKETE